MGLANKIRVVETEVLNQVHEATVEILETVGIEFQLDEAVEILKQGGARVEGHRVFIPRKMLDVAIEAAPASFKLWGRDEEKSIIMGEGQTRVHVEPSNGPVFAQDIKGGKRKGTMEDLINFYKLAQTSDVCDVSGAIPVEPSDIDAKGRHLRIFYEMIKHTDKPIRNNVGTYKEVEEMFEMFEIAVGEKGYLKTHPSIYVSINPLSPLAYDSKPLQTIITFAKYGQPVTILSCTLAGISAPVSPLGAAALQNAEMLAGLVLMHQVNPGTPYIYSPSSAMPNMQNAQYITGSPESNLINIINLQLALELYKLPTRTMAGLTDAKTIDAQAGYETMQNLFMCIAGGSHVINECLGVMDSIMTNSFEKFILDEEMISRMIRIMDGVGTSEKDFALDVIKSVGPQGSFLMHPSTMAACRGAWRPEVSTWDSYDKWEKAGTPDVVETANKAYLKRISAAPDTLLSDSAEAKLQAFMAAAV
jgi:trimethylamine--corrinoid protein Co-methyltransferase